MIYLLLSAAAVLGCTVGLPSSYPVGDIRSCPTSQLMDSSKSLKLINVLPGVGFDALRSLDQGQIYQYNYSICQLSPDGQHLLPNNFRLIPISHSQVDYTAEVFDSYSDWKSETSHSLNVNAKVSYAHINAKFSMDYQKTKSKVVKDKSRSTRIGLRHHLYSVEINPDSQLNPMFKSRIYDIAANIQNNNSKIAHYLSELLMRDYGTHVVTSVDAGAILSQTSFFQDQSESDAQTSHLSISASASASFYSVFSINMKYAFSTDESQTQSFQKSTTSSYTTTHGGPPFKLGNNFTYSDWENEIEDNLVAIDRRGEPLYSVITPTTVPELPTVMISQVSKYLYKAITRYYKVNTHTGCSTYSPLSGNVPKNFNFHANIDDGSCEKAQPNFTFGGIYQTCENLDDHDVCASKQASQKNPLTDDHSCPDGYIEIQLHSGSLRENVKNYERKCKWFKKYDCKTETHVKVKSARYEAFWCALPPGDSEQYGLSFGGIYSATEVNVITAQKSCPQFYFPLHFGEDTQVCVSSDVQASTSSLKFGGFYSCSAGNPMASTKKEYSSGNYPKLCPTHYSRLMVTVDEDCIINYCTDIRQVLKYEPQPPILPPFRRSFNLVHNNASEVLLLTDASGVTWVKESNGEWKEAVDEDTITTGQQWLNVLTSVPANTIANSSTNFSDINNADAFNVYTDRYSFSDSQLFGIIVATAVGTVSVIAFVWIIGLGVRRFQKSKKKMKQAVLTNYVNDEHIPIINVE